MIEPTLGLKIVIWGGWMLVILGVAKMILWLVGEIPANSDGGYQGLVGGRIG